MSLRRSLSQAVVQPESDNERATPSAGEDNLRVMTAHETPKVSFARNRTVENISRCPRNVTGLLQKVAPAQAYLW